MDDGPVFRTPAEDLVEADRRTRRPSLVWSDWASAGTDDPGGGGYLDAVSVALAVWLVISVAVGFLVAMLSSDEA